MCLLIKFAFVQFNLCSVHRAYSRIAESIDVRMAMLYMFLNPVSDFIVLFDIFSLKQTNQVKPYQTDGSFPQFMRFVLHIHLVKMLQKDLKQTGDH